MYHLGLVGTIRIYHECEGGIEKSVSKIINWHNEACQVMTIGDQGGRIFYPILTRIMDSFSCSPLNTLFILEKRCKVIQKILNTLRCDMVMSY